MTGFEYLQDFTSNELKQMIEEINNQNIKDTFSEYRETQKDKKKYIKNILANRKIRSF